ncbi:MAG: potassium channel family protein [Nitrolancea sp.]
MAIWISVLLGCLIISLVIVDIVLTLFTPSLQGRLNVLLVGFVWRVAAPLARRSPLARELTGPATFLSVISLWATMIGLGWALIYWPFLPKDFLVNFGIDLDRTSANNFMASIYLSFVILATLGFGDIVPTSGILRLVVVSEALVGFGLLTAGISWFLSIDPALSRRRVLSHKIALIENAEREVHPLAEWDDQTLANSMRDIALELAAVQSDLQQYPIIYYFRHADPDTDIVLKLPYLLRVARRARAELDESQLPVELRSAMLERAVVDLLETIALQHLGHKVRDADELMAMCLADHAVKDRKSSRVLP